MKSPFPLHQESDCLPRRWLFGLAGGSVMLTLVAVWLSALLGRTSQVARPATPLLRAAQASPLEQSLIEQDARGLQLQREQRGALERYGWVDRDAGVVQLPIERAMRLNVEKRP